MTRCKRTVLPLTRRISQRETNQSIPANKPAPVMPHHLLVGSSSSQNLRHEKVAKQTMARTAMRFAHIGHMCAMVSRNTADR